MMQEPSFSLGIEEEYLLVDLESLDLCKFRHGGTRFNILRQNLITPRSHASFPFVKWPTRKAEMY